MSRQPLSHPRFWKLVRRSIDRDLVCCWLILMFSAWGLRAFLPISTTFVGSVGVKKGRWWRPLHNRTPSVDPAPFTQLWLKRLSDRATVGSFWVFQLQQRFLRPQLNFSVLDCPLLSFLFELPSQRCRGFITVASQAVVGTLNPAGQPLHFKWLIYCSPSMWKVMENQCSIWAQRHFMLTLHCSLLIFMQMFQLHCVY